MAVNTANVRTGTSGVVAVGPIATTAPTSATAQMPTGFIDLGAVSEDGITEARERSTNQIIIWQDAAVARESVTEASFTLNLTLVESKKEVIETYYGATVSGTDGSYVIVPASTGGRKSYLVDVVDAGKVKRIYIPSGEVTEVGDVVYQNGEPVGYEITITAYYGTYGTGGTAFTGAAKVWDSGLIAA